MKPGLFLGKMENVTYYLLICTYQKGSKIVHLKKYIVFKMKNSKVFEQKGDLLNFKANIDPRAVLSQIKPGWAEEGCVKLCRVESS